MTNEKNITTEDGLSTLQDQIDELGQEILATAFAYTDRLRKGKKITADEEYKQVEMQRQFKYIESTFNKLKKAGRITGVAGSTADDNFLKKILQRKSSIASIVVNDTTKDNNNG